MKHTRKFVIAALVLFAIFTNNSLLSEELRFEKDIQNCEKLDQASPPKIGGTLFVGSSTWTLWKQIPEDFEEFGAVNRGFGGSTIPDQLRVMDRIVTPYKPARVLFFCGTNDIAGGAEPETVFENFKTFLQRLRENNPEVKVFFVSPSHAPVREKFWAKGDKLCQMVRDLTKQDSRLFFIDTITPMEGQIGVWQEDRLHLSRRGQEIWIPVIKAALTENL